MWPWLWLGVVSSLLAEGRAAPRFSARFRERRARAIQAVAAERPRREDVLQEVKVFVYNHSTLDNYLAGLDNYSFKAWGLGNVVNDRKGKGYRFSGNSALGAAMLYRLWTDLALVTKDPKEADLFLMPVIADGPPYREHTEEEKVIAKSDKEILFHDIQEELRSRHMQSMCDHLWSDDLAAKYSYLTPETAFYHAFVTIDYTFLPNWCVVSPGYTYHEDIPVSEELLRTMIWVSHEVFAPLGKDQKDYRARVDHFFKSERKRAAIVVNVPFIPCVHSQHQLHNRTHGLDRTYLMSFGGSFAGMELGMRLRRKVVDDCHSYGAPTCKALTNRPDSNFEENNLLVEAFELKRQSVFCLEPAGYSIIRSAVADAIALGCIPVLFLTDDGTQHRVYPWHWSGWLERSTVIVSLHDYLEGRVDLKATLSDIPQERVEEMQRTIEKNAHRFIINEDNSYDLADAFDITLAGMAFQMRTPKLFPAHRAVRDEL